MIEVGVMVAASVMAGGCILILRRLRRYPASRPFTVREGAFASLAAHELKASGVTSNALAAIDSAIQPDPDSPFQWQGGVQPAEASGFGSSKILWGAATADAVWPGVEMVNRWLSVDPHVYQGVAHMTHKEVNNFADLLTVVKERDYDLATEGFIQKLKGHVGEWHVQEHLQQAGHAVSMPLKSNEGGWDVQADNLTFNVKTTKNAAAAGYGHFADHPDIPIIVPHDAANIPADALHFDPSHAIDMTAAHGNKVLIVDDALSNAEVLSQTEYAVDVLQDPGPALHFPWITLAVSAVREGRLIYYGNTDVTRAMKNVAVDTAAVGGGGMAGAKGGALIGASFGGPVGAAVGGVIGGIAGAMAGRAAANSIKAAPLKAARTAYDQALAKYSAKEKEVVLYVDRSWHTFQSQAQAEMVAAVGAAKARQADRIDQLLAATVASVGIPKDVAEKQINAALSEIACLEGAARRSWRARGLMATLVPELVVPAEYIAWREFRVSAREWSKLAQALITKWQNSPTDVERFFDLMLALPVGDALARAFVRRTIVTRKRALEALAQEPAVIRSEVLTARARLVAQLRQYWNQLQADANKLMDPVVSALSVSADNLRGEMRKAGMQV